MSELSIAGTQTSRSSFPPPIGQAATQAQIHVKFPEGTPPTDKFIMQHNIATVLTEKGISHSIPSSDKMAHTPFGDIAKKLKEGIKFSVKDNQLADAYSAVGKEIVRVKELGLEAFIACAKRAR
jgi:hypothetical protein